MTPTGGSTSPAAGPMQSQQVHSAGAASPPPPTLMSRVAALEGAVKRAEQHPGSLPSDKMVATGNGGAAGNVSTRSAPEGTLLNRVEMLEDQLMGMLEAQQLHLHEQQRLLAEALTTPASPAQQSDCCCGCCIM